MMDRRLFTLVLALLLLAGIARAEDDGSAKGSVRWQAYNGKRLGILNDRITQNNYSFAFRKNDPGSAALGYSNRRRFFRIILPQALPHVLPAYKGEIVGLIKATAIVGYIAVRDLTKTGDIVRSRTYEAFFPLIAVTIIYFLLESLIGFLVSRISVNFKMDSARRSFAEQQDIVDSSSKSTARTTRPRQSRSQAIRSITPAWRWICTSG